MEVETSILDTLADLEKAERVIILDAIKAKGEPGTVYRLCIERCDSPNDIASMHSLDIFAVLALSGLNKPGDVVALGIEPANARELSELGVRITAAANEQLGFHHPGNPDWDHVSFCQFAEPLTREGNVLRGRNAVAIRPGKIDRSPTGTGVSARLAVLHARGELGVGQSLLARSIIDSEFTGRIEEAVTVGGKPAIIPSVEGRAWITGKKELLCDPDDPWPEGYRVADTWPSDN